MELRHLRCFIAVAEELHFGNAARKLGLAQPPLSLCIKQLEEELGVLLFRRTSRSVALTTAGADLLANARSILAHAKQWTEQARGLAHGRSGPLRIGFVSAAMNVSLPDSLRLFRKHYLNVRCSLHLMDTETQLEALRYGEIDVGILRAYRQDLRGLQAYTFHREKYLCGVPSAHRLASRKYLTPKMLRKETLISHP